MEAKNNLQSENEILRKRQTIYHNGICEMGISLCKDLSAQDRLYEIDCHIKSILIHVAKVDLETTIVLV